MINNGFLPKNYVRPGAFSKSKHQGEYTIILAFLRVLWYIISRKNER